MGCWSSSCCDDSFQDGTPPGRAPVDLEASLLGRALLLTGELSAPPCLHPRTSLFTGFSFPFIS